MRCILARRVERSGFTLVELLVVCGIVGLMLVLAVPTVAGTLESMRVKNAAAALAADIRLAQVYAQREGMRARVVFSPDLNSYSVEVATSQMASEDCASTQYQVRKTQALESSLLFKKATFSCMVFEPTGRTAWSNPKVLQGETTLPDSKSTVWNVFHNGVEVAWDYAVGTDPNANTWTDPAAGVVKVTVDLGSARFVETVCPQVIRDAGDAVDFPESVQVEWSTDMGPSPPPPGSGHWVVSGSKTKPYVEAIQSPNGNDWWRACPEFALDLTTRYLRFTFVPSAFLPGDFPMMALDEIKTSDPSVVVSTLNGKKSRKLTIAPITGRVTIH